MKTYVQYITIGFGLIENIRQVTSRNTDDVVEHILEQEGKIKNIKVIGFRFFDKEDKSENPINVSGVYYLRGEVFTYPELSNEMLQFVNKMGYKYKIGQQLILIVEQYPIINEFNAKDKKLDIEKIKRKIERKRRRELAEKIEKDISAYKEALCKELLEVVEDIKKNNYNAIKLFDLEDISDAKVVALNLLGDKGNFVKHIQYLKEEHKKKYDLESELSNIDSIE